MNIVTPLVLDKSTIQKIKKRYTQLLSEVDQSHLDFVNKKFDRIYKNLSRFKNWKGDLVEAVKIMLEQSNFSNVLSPTDKHVIACAYYLCDIDDIIPDHSPGGIGYIDDAYIVNETTTRLQRVNNVFLYTCIDKFEDFKNNQN